MTLNRQILRRVDDRLRSESDQEKGEWMAKVPISGATKSVWQRYCDAAGVHMGQGVAILIHHELASVVDEDLETLGDRLRARQTELDSRALALDKAEEELERRRRDLEVREVRVMKREEDFKKREDTVAVIERRLAQPPRQGPSSRVTASKLGRNDPCWCGSGKKYKVCHLP